MSVAHFFRSEKIVLTDGSELWEVVTPEGERIATTTREATADFLETTLNLALTEWVDNEGNDAQVCL